MPLDGICMQAVAEELRPELLGLRIDKVQQPARDQVILLLRGNKRLLLNAGANTPRIQLTALTRDNPAEPPMFCMLLRKHLVGGRVAAVTQPPLERLVRLELDVTDDFGQPGRRTLVLEELSRAETEQDFLDIRGELRDAGFLRRQGKKEQNRPAKPLEFRTTSGFRVLVGRNNRQNDKLTRSADHRDIWLHTQKIHGSHVILCTGGREVDDDTIVEAAKLAAWFSQAREGANVPVDYTPVKNVKKPAGARPGMVIYSTCRTVNVAPEEGLVKKLQLS